MPLDQYTGLPYRPLMEVSFDPDKDAKNRAKHKLPLLFGVEVLTNKCGEVEDQRRDYGEKPMKAFAQINGLWFQCVYTMRGGLTHIINVHRDKEMQQWLKTSERR
jgi:uncharacterized DUF497 family protein